MKFYTLPLAAAIATVGISTPLQVNAGETFGPNVGASVYVDATKFRPISDSSCSLVISSAGLYFRNSCVLGQVFYATFELPEGARIIDVYTHYFDNDAGNSLESELMKFNTVWSGGGTPTTTFDAGTTHFTSVDSTDFQTDTVVPANLVYDSYNGSTSTHSIYGVRVSMPGNAANVSYRGAWILYQRQIAPAPVSASFSDVPTNHPFFREVEQLSKSGVTTGCGGGAYCPDAAVTRGQMAAFLSRAMGLGWDFSTNPS